MSMNTAISPLHVTEARKNSRSPLSRSPNFDTTVRHTEDFYSRRSTRMLNETDLTHLHEGAVDESGSDGPIIKQIFEDGQQ